MAKCPDRHIAAVSDLIDKENMMTNSIKKISLAAAIALLVTGCSSTEEPSMAQMMRSHAGSMQSQVELQNQLAKDWETGTKMVARAKEQSIDAQQRIQEAEE